MKRVAFDVTFLQDNAAQKTLSLKSRVLLNLLSHHNVRGGAYPGRATIARELCISERSVRRALGELEVADLIRRDGKYKGHARYRLPVGKKNELLGGPDRWKIIEDFHSTLARIRPHAGADSSARWRESVRKGGADSSSPPGANMRQFQSGTDKINGSEHPIEHPRTSLEHPPCLLYTSDAADDLLCVDLCGRRNIK